MKYLMSLVMILFLGCASKEYIFVPSNEKSIKKSSAVIEIKEVKLPLYMRDLEIMELKKDNLVPTKKYLSKEVSEIIISKLSNRLLDPNVGIYPMDKKADYIISLKIDDFYLKDSKIYLFGRLYINSSFIKISVVKNCKNEFYCVNNVFNEIVNKIVKEIK